MMILDGKAVAQVRRAQMAAKVTAFKAKYGRAPGLAVILVGEDPASQVYVRNKVAACHEVGIASQEAKLNKEASRAEVERAIARFNEANDIDGILLQLPLPAHLPGNDLIEMIAPEKDPDGLTMANMGRLFAGKPRSISCTPYGVMKILEHYKIPVAGKHAVVIGRSNIVGKPMAHLLLQANATVTICHSQTPDLAAVTRTGDIVVVAAGKPEFVGRDYFKKGAVVVDVGIHRRALADGKTKLCGDVKAAELDGWVAALTPVPGGVGPMTITMLLENTIHLAEQRAGR
jgi:methylenetetrahydrofolate dehydrogenase (NADP+) / methenyltetrahydrofolate cyclohydrolase